MGALKCFWDAKEVDLRSKFLMYNTIPISLLLWGSKRWALTKVFIKKLEVFHLRNIRRILGIKRSEVIDDKIKNKQVLEKNCDINYIACYISKRRLTFIGRIIRIKNDRVPARLISAFIYEKRPVGRPNFSTRHLYISDIKK